MRNTGYHRHNSLDQSRFQPVFHCLCRTQGRAQRWRGVSDGYQVSWTVFRQIDAVGMYPVGGQVTFGAVPHEAYKDYLREARGDSEVILRLEITSGQYERALKYVHEWQKRAREDALVYKEPYSQVSLNNVLLVRAVSETLNLCQNDFDLYKLDYVHPTDWISDKTAPTTFRLSSSKS